MEYDVGHMAPALNFTHAAFLWLTCVRMPPVQGARVGALVKLRFVFLVKQLLHVANIIGKVADDVWQP